MAKHMEVTDGIDKDREKFDTHRYLAPAEHVVIGSTAKVGDGTFASVDFFRMISEGGMSEEYRKPPAVKDGSVENANNARKKAYLAGALSPFTVDQIDIMFDYPHTSQAFFPGELDEEGLIGDSFKVAIVDTDTDEIVHPELLDKLVLAGEWKTTHEIKHNDDHIMIAPIVPIFK